jgi:hypothetical protein
MNPSTTPSTGFDPPRSPPDFSLVLGGPLFQLLRGARLEDDAATTGRPAHRSLSLC